MKQNSADVQEVVVDFDKLMNGHDRSQDVLLQADDVIYIPETPKVVLISRPRGQAGRRRL